MSAYKDSAADRTNIMTAADTKLTTFGGAVISRDGGAVKRRYLALSPPQLINVIRETRSPETQQTNSTDMANEWTESHHLEQT